MAGHADNGFGNARRPPRCGTATVIPRFIIAVLLALAALVTDGCESHQTPQSPSDRITHLRYHGKYPEAAVIARRLAEDLDRDPSVPPWKIVETRLLAETLALVATLPAEAQTAIREADRLTPEIEQYVLNADYTAAARQARHQLFLRSHYLGQSHVEAVESLGRLGAILLAQGAYAGADTLLKKAVRMRQDLFTTEHPHVAESLDRLGMLFLLKGNFAKAEPRLREALALRRRLLGEDHGDVALSLKSLAAYYFERGYYVEAEQHFREALAVQRRSEPRANQAMVATLSGLGGLLVRQGDPAAGQVLNEALKIGAMVYDSTHPAVAAILEHVGYLAYREDDFGNALQRIGEAHSDFNDRLGENHPRTLACRRVLAKILHEHHDYDEAEDLLRKTIAAARPGLGHEHPLIAMCLGELAHCRMDHRACSEAEALFEEALTMLRQFYDDGHPEVSKTLVHTAHCYLTQHRLDPRKTIEAEQRFTEAASAFEQARLRGGLGFCRATSLISPYERLAVSRLILGMEETAWQAAECARGRVLGDLLLADDAGLLGRREASRADSLARSLNRYEEQLAILRAAAESENSKDVERWLEATQNLCLRTQASWIDFQQRIAAEYSAPKGRTFELGRIQAALADGTAIIGWVCPMWVPIEHMAWVYVIRSAGPVRWACISDSSWTGRHLTTAYCEIHDFRESLAKAGCWPIHVALADRERLRAKEIYAEWIEPAMPHLDGIEHLVVIPSGPMLGIPIEALADTKGTYLADRYSISYAPSATLRTWVHEREVGQAYPGSQRALLVGDPPFTEDHLEAMRSEEPERPLAGSPGGSISSSRVTQRLMTSLLRQVGLAPSDLPRLMATREEIEHIAKVIPDPMILLGAEATEENLSKLAETGEIGRFDTIHLATHAVMSDSQPENSALVLSLVDLPDPIESLRRDRRLHDGLLRAKEIAREWKLDANLVTLSACRTGLGGLIAGEGYIGLAQAFLQAGARSVIVSLWRVEDKATCLLMNRLYRNLNGDHNTEPMTKAEALSEAKTWLRMYTDEEGNRPYHHPAYWSPFVLIGES